MNERSVVAIYGVVADGNLRTAYEKGEIKDRYWNPCGMFKRVHVLVLADDDTEPKKVQRVAGRAELCIHPVGSVMPYGKGYAKITVYQIALKLLGWEKYTYRNADRIVPKYEAAARLVRKSGYGCKVRVIYNQIFLEKFVDLKPRMATGERLKIINVGRQFAGKDQRPLIEALAEIDAELTLVGTGPMRDQLERVAARFGVAGRVTFIDSVPNHELPGVFVGHHVFAINISQPGVCMPVMEAMALGLPVVINRPRWDAEPEVVDAHGSWTDHLTATESLSRSLSGSHLSSSNSERVADCASKNSAEKRWRRESET